MYRIFCRVSGGVTGTRTGYMKDENFPSGYREFDTLEETETEVARLMKDMNSGFGAASYYYRAEKVSE